MTPNRLRLIVELRQRIKDGTAKELRRAANLTLAEVGERIGRDETSVHRYEKGERFPRTDVAIQWALLLREIEREITRSKSLREAA